MADESYCDRLERQTELEAFLVDELRLERKQFAPEHVWRHVRGLPLPGDKRIIPAGRFVAQQGLTLELSELINDKEWRPEIVSLEVYAQYHRDFPSTEEFPKLQRPMRELILSFSSATNPAISHFLQSPGFSSLLRLEYHPQVNPVSCFTILCELINSGAVDWQELRHLVLKVQAHHYSLMLFAGLPVWESISSFTFECAFGVEQKDWAEFFEVWQAPSLRHLTLRAGNMQNKGTLAFAKNPTLEGLRYLEIHTGKLGVTAFRAFINSPYLQQLLVLKIIGTGMKKEYEALADPSIFPQARRIEISERNLPSEVVEKLRGRKGVEVREF
ncbi:MAG: hypothetical protein ACRC8S_07830 [Fimbriiglobus sp.]